MKSPVMLHPLISVLFGTSRLAELDPRFSSHLIDLSSEVSVHGNVVVPGFHFKWGQAGRGALPPS